MPRLVFGPDPMFNEAVDPELYQRYKPQSLKATGWGGAPEAAMSIGSSILEGLSRGRALSQASAERDKANKLNALRSERDRIAGDKTLEESSRAARLGELDAKINEVGIASTEHPGPTTPAHGVLGHVGRFFSNAIDRVAGPGGQKVDLGTAGDKPWLQDFQSRVADPTVTARVLTPDEAANLAAEGVRESYEEAKQAGDPNVGNFVLRNPKVIRALPHLSPAYQQMLAGRAPVDVSVDARGKREQRVFDTLAKPPEARTEQDAGIINAAVRTGAAAPDKPVIVGRTGEDGRTTYRWAVQDLVNGGLVDSVTKERLAGDWLPSGERGAPFGVNVIPSAQGLVAANPMTGQVSKTPFGVYFDKNAAAYHNALAGASGWQMHNLQNLEKANGLLAQVRAAANGNPTAMNVEFNRRVAMGEVDPMLAEMARTLWQSQDFTGSRTEANAASAAQRQATADVQAAISGILRPGGGAAPPAAKPQASAPAKGGADEYHRLMGGGAAQYAAPGVPVAAGGTPLAAPAQKPGVHTAAYEEFLKGFGARGTRPSDIYGQQFGAGTAGSSPAAVYQNLY
jgi:hypothetical protein